LLTNIRTAGSYILRALPLAILLFFFFPRIQGNFGFIPSQDEQGKANQLSNSLLAGSIADRAFDDSLAFRVEFDDAIPKPEQRYWRAKVMTKENNFQWSLESPSDAELAIARGRIRSESGSTANSDQHFSYEIIHEESNDAYAPFLDYALNQSIGTQLDDYSVYLSTTKKGIFVYEATSSSEPYLNSSEVPDIQGLTATQSIPRARTLALLSKWREETSSDAELVERVFEHFQQPQFTYTLLPEALGDNPIEEFLFDVQSGYCEHYASVYTILMRWLGIPARVVVGYQGGSQNQVGDYFEVKYSDAHAWSEVWLDGSWKRVDPTSAITPDRIIYGMDSLLSRWNGIPFSGSQTGRALADFLNPTGINQLIKQIGDGWDNLGYQWNKWVVNYDFDSQKQLLSTLGMEHRNSLYTLVGLLFAGTVLLMLFYFWQLIPRAVKIGEVQQAYLQFVSRFKRHKIAKQLFESPYEFASKVKSAFPHQAEEIDEITGCYVQIRYGHSQHSTSDSIESFKLQVKRFKLPNSSPANGN
jgi:transglutaminase-like putative cysteine protease